MQMTIAIGPSKDEQIEHMAEQIGEMKSSQGIPKPHSKSPVCSWTVGTFAESNV